DDLGEVGNVERMAKHVLPIAGAVAEPAEHGDDGLGDVGDVGFLNGFLADLHQLFVHFFGSLSNQFFDARGMNPAVLDEALQRDAGDFATNRIEATDDDDTGSVVDDDIHASRLFKAADISTFAADDAAFHVIRRNRNGAHRVIAGLLGGVALDGLKDDLP